MLPFRNENKSEKKCPNLNKYIKTQTKTNHEEENLSCNIICQQNLNIFTPIPYSRVVVTEIGNLDSRYLKHSTPTTLSI